MYIDIHIKFQQLEADIFDVDYRFVSVDGTFKKEGMLNYVSYRDACNMIRVKFRAFQNMVLKRLDLPPVHPNDGEQLSFLPDDQ